MRVVLSIARLSVPIVVRTLFDSSDISIVTSSRRDLPARCFHFRARVLSRRKTLIMAIGIRQNVSVG